MPPKDFRHNQPPESGINSEFLNSTRSMGFSARYLLIYLLYLKTYQEGVDASYHLYIDAFADGCDPEFKALMGFNKTDEQLITAIDEFLKDGNAKHLFFTGTKGLSSAAGHACFIHFEKNEDKKLVSATFYDPYGAPSPLELSEHIQELIRASPHVPGLTLQSNADSAQFDITTCQVVCYQMILDIIFNHPHWTLRPAGKIMSQENLLFLNNLLYMQLVNAVAIIEKKLESIQLESDGSMPLYCQKVFLLPQVAEFAEELKAKNIQLDLFADLEYQALMQSLVVDQPFELQLKHQNTQFFSEHLPGAISDFNLIYETNHQLNSESTELSVPAINAAFTFDHKITEYASMLNVIMRPPFNQTSLDIAAYFFSYFYHFLHEEKALEIKLSGNDKVQEYFTRELQNSQKLRQ